MKIFGLFGEHLSHSLSPAIHNIIYEIINLEATYSLYQIRPDMLKDAVQGIRALDLRGVNVTIPYKVKIMEYLDEISTEAQKIGAVNTVLNINSVLTGYNTDYIGFGRMLNKYGVEAKGKTAVILGSGGAAKSVITYLEDAGISELIVVSRDPSSIHSFLNHKVITYEYLSQLEQKDLLINCTPIGMYPNTGAAPITHNETARFETVIDLIYNPSVTQLLQQAINMKIPAYNGLYMLVSQAVAAVEIWNGINISDKIVDEVYEKLMRLINKGK